MDTDIIEITQDFGVDTDEAEEILETANDLDITYEEAQEIIDAGI